MRPNFRANSSIDELLNEMQSRYAGKVVAARDLDVYQSARDLTQSTVTSLCVKGLIDGSGRYACPNWPHCR